MAVTSWANGRTIRAMFALVVSTYGDSCWLCGTPGADSIDHVVPRAAGGGDDLANLRPAHRRCNSRRGVRPAHPVTQPGRHSREW